MDFNVIPSSALLHLYVGSLFASDGQTDGRTDGRTACQFLGALCFDNNPFGVDKETRSLVVDLQGGPKKQSPSEISITPMPKIDILVSNF